ncbi:MAG: peroxiredoxin, partial [Bowdeniella nasicola]|nr:peroxiredoxin [Bowdeniella nasicola]
MSERLAVGEIAPEFTLPTPQGAVSLDGLLDQCDTGVIVYCYPKAQTPGCTRQACDFRDALTALRHGGYRVVGISPDPIENLERFAAAESLCFPLASDPDHHTLAAYGAWG